MLCCACLSAFDAPLHALEKEWAPTRRLALPSSEDPPNAVLCAVGREHLW